MTQKMNLTFYLSSLITCQYKKIITIINISYVSVFNFNTLSFSKLLSRFWNSSNSVMSSPANPSSVLAISKSSSLIVIGRNDEGGGAGKGGWIYNNKVLSNWHHSAITCPCKELLCFDCPFLTKHLSPCDIYKKILLQHFDFKED